MNRLMSDALIDAGFKEADARAAAIEAGRNDLRSTMLEYAIKELRTDLRREIAEGSKKVIHTTLIALGLATLYLSLLALILSSA